MSEEAIRALEKRIQDNRDWSDQQVEKIYERINEVLAPAAWWVKPVRVLLYALIGLLVVTIIGSLTYYGLLPEGTLETVTEALAERARGD